MKQIIVVACILAVSNVQSLNLNPEYMARLQSVKDDCVRESNADAGLVERLLQAGTFAEDGKLKCFQKCVFVKLNVMDVSGKIEDDLVRSQLPISVKVEVEEAMQRCRRETGADPCDIAFRVAKCFYQL